MKIQVIKKATNRIKLMEPCPFVVDVPPDASKKQ